MSFYDSLNIHSITKDGKTTTQTPQWHQSYLHLSVVNSELERKSFKVASKLHWCNSMVSKTASIKCTNTGVISTIAINFKIRIKQEVLWCQKSVLYVCFCSAYSIGFLFPIARYRKQSSVVKLSLTMRLCVSLRPGLFLWFTSAQRLTCFAPTLCPNPPLL